MFIGTKYWRGPLVPTIAVVYAWLDPSNPYQCVTQAHLTHVRYCG